MPAINTRWLTAPIIRWCIVVSHTSHG